MNDNPIIAEIARLISENKPPICVSQEDRKMKPNKMVFFIFDDETHEEKLIEGSYAEIMEWWRQASLYIKTTYPKLNITFN